MPDYIVTGRKGAGKTLAMVGRMREYIERGRPIATNIDLNLRELVRKEPAAPVWRLPDLPTLGALQALGSVHETGCEELNGALVFDECSAFLNSRNWNERGRDGLVVWLAHARKMGWDCYFMVQAVTMLDKQVRESFGEYVVQCRRLDRLKVPVVGRIGSALTLGLWSGKMPQIHMASVFYGLGPQGVHAETWTYRGRDLYAAFNTAQKIGANDCGLHRLTWYETDAERRRRKPTPKPKLELVRWIERLPVDRRIPAMRRIGLA